MNRRDHFKGRALRLSAVDLVAADDNVLKALLTPLVGDVISQIVVALGTGDMWFRSEAIVVPRPDGEWP